MAGDNSAKSSSGFRAAFVRPEECLMFNFDMGYPHMEVSGSYQEAIRYRICTT